MEYVGGTSLKEILERAPRGQRRAAPEPLPAAQAIAYMLEILPALGYLHGLGLLFCDFKLDNVIQTEHSLKLIDLGGVYRHRRRRRARSTGRSATRRPRSPSSGPSVSSDLYTVGAHARACCASTSRATRATFQSTLPPPDERPALRAVRLALPLPAQGDRARPRRPLPVGRRDGRPAPRRPARGRRRETGTPAPGPSTLFTGDLRARLDGPDWRLLPALLVATDDPAAGYLATLAATDPAELAELLRAAPDRTVEVDLRLTRALIEAGDLAAADALIKQIEENDPWEWRAEWYRGLVELARDRPRAAEPFFRSVYRAVPGELAPKLALGAAAEAARIPAAAVGWYDVGLAHRSLVHHGDLRAGALLPCARRPGRGAGGLRPDREQLEHLHRGADRPDPLPHRGRQRRAGFGRRPHRGRRGAARPAARGRAARPPHRRAHRGGARDTPGG